MPLPLLSQFEVKNEDGTLFLGDGSLAAAPTPKLNQRGIRNIIKVVDDRCLVFDPPEDNPVQKFSRSVVPVVGKKVKDQVFAFDRIFDENANQTEVYEATTKTLLDSVLDGYNATVFAYGATGCGKTHTITGTSQQPGIIFLTMQELFEKIADRNEEKQTEVTLSYLEIYNETIRDLLVPGGSKQGLMLREDSNQAVTVAGLTSHHPKDVQEVMDMIVQGNAYRTVSPTAANATSSRSHAVLQINVAQKDRNAAVNEPHTMATLSIIDLAGSERASATLNRGERLLEGANINKSLLALGSCINALCDARRKNHVPYRNSKLTRLLKFSLGGNCRTVMIVCVSPSSEHFDETQNTLRYANRAKNIQTKVTRNVFNVNRHVKDFLVKIDEQMALINQLKAQQKEAEGIFFAKFKKNIEKRQQASREGIQRIRAAYDNASADRQDKINTMKKLKLFERRIGMLSAWIAAFDTVCDAREDEKMPPNLAAMRKTAQGILVELESSRHHIHQKLGRSNWERALDSALQHSILQLPSGDGIADCGEAASLSREADALKAQFTREANQQILEQEKGADAAIIQALLSAQFQMISSMADLMALDEEDAVAQAKDIIKRLLETGYSAASHVIKPDGSMMPAEMFPPSKRGTPKRKKGSSIHVKAIPAPSFVAAPPTPTREHAPSPLKSPRRRRVVNTRKSVSFSPAKKRLTPKRIVRWRDDETEDGTLADYDKTPKKFDPSPSPQHAGAGTAAAAAASPDTSILPRPTVPSYLPNNDDAASDASPSLVLPETSSIPTSKPSRFQAGFLSKSRSPQGGKDGRGSSPLRSLDVDRTGNNLSPPSSGSLRSSPKPPRLTPLDENSPPPAANANASLSPSASNSDSEPTATIDATKLRTALHLAKRRDRLSSMGSTASSNAKRISSVGTTGGIDRRRSLHRVSSSYSGPLASSTNGISRQRRRSGSTEQAAGRHKNPPMSCSPPGGARAFTAGQARRMNMGGSMKLDGMVSPRTLADKATPSRSGIDVKARRITIGGAAAGGMPAPGKRSSVVWR
ncbi:kinesin-domain-containing protein [Cryphonectria parasitica EP155]|uniref:Kinesin-domain-containing protein n=1 Tax=Cryphonectria parasitica (strain ATCC 38755 / EP155) TaxID=660469 RepID=A0A9P4Y0T7_CRYP1|nr:kinesin-domain-containing protein [Cryphonectria parasitica EP155]KAF3764305.1 kinesin-domain-containing protein [Cryphonectria parasitica EP155]